MGKSGEVTLSRMFVQIFERFCPDTILFDNSFSLSPSPPLSLSLSSTPYLSFFLSNARDKSLKNDLHPMKIVFVFGFKFRCPNTNSVINLRIEIHGSKFKSKLALKFKFKWKYEFKRIKICSGNFKFRFFFLDMTFRGSYTHLDNSFLISFGTVFL